MSAPLISLVVPTYNRARYLGDCIRSALAQGLGDFEIVVADDGSTDGTAALVEGLRDPRLRYLRKPHGGASETRNFAIAAARGEFVFNLDSDDVLLVDTLESYAQAQRAFPEVDVFYADLIVTDARLQALRALTYPDWYGRNADLIGELLAGSPVPNGGAMIRRRAFERLGGYDPAFARAHDYEWWSRAAGSLAFKRVDTTSLAWRWHDANMSSGSVAIDTSWEARALARILLRYPLRQLVRDAGWEERPLPEAESQALLRVAARLAGLGDLAGALRHAEQACALSPAPQARALLERLRAGHGTGATRHSITAAPESGMRGCRQHSTGNETMIIE
jgi:glycosyltransferase involved in cell wall biosynthesis